MVLGECMFMWGASLGAWFKIMQCRAANTPFTHNKNKFIFNINNRSLVISKIRAYWRCRRLLFRTIYSFTIIF